MSFPGTRIKELRKISGMSQEELGKRVGVQRVAIQKYEKGYVTNIPLATIEKIAGVFDVSPTYLVGWEEIKGNTLSLESKILDGVSRLYGEDAIRLLEIYTTITKDARSKLLGYAEDIDLLYSEDKL